MFSVSPSTYVSTSEEVPLEIRGWCRIHKDGRFERLAGTTTVPAGSDPLTGVQSKDVVLSSKNNVSVRIYIPKFATSNEKLPTLIYFHGGGYKIESATSSTYHPTLNLITRESNVIAVSVDYRLAPEYPIPTMYEDSWEAIRWVASHDSGNGPDKWLNDYADLKNVFLGGDSVGANIAHNMAIRVGLNLNHASKIELKGLILLHPFFNGEEPIEPKTRKDKEFEAAKDYLWNLVNPMGIERDDPLFNPGTDPNVSGLRCSKILVCIGEKDKLRGMGLYYKKVMQKSGWVGRVDVLESKGEGHVFFLHNTSSENSCTLRKRICIFINPIRSKA
nr:probable carboxylesterase 2 [Tanacetum cinerariifolium]